MKIYVATSWSHAGYPTMLAVLRDYGYEVHDFKSPEHAFNWADVKRSSAADYKRMLADPRVAEAYAFDVKAIHECDALVMMLPCGRSAHLELGYARGLGKPSIVFFPMGWIPDASFLPETMHLLATDVVEGFAELRAALVRVDQQLGRFKR